MKWYPIHGCYEGGRGREGEPFWGRLYIENLLVHFCIERDVLHPKQAFLRIWLRCPQIHNFQTRWARAMPFGRPLSTEEVFCLRLCFIPVDAACIYPRWFPAFREGCILIGVGGGAGGAPSLFSGAVARFIWNRRVNGGTETAARKTAMRNTRVFPVYIIPIYIPSVYTLYLAIGPITRDFSRSSLLRWSGRWNASNDYIVFLCYFELGSNRFCIHLVSVYSIKVHYTLNGYVENEDGEGPIGNLRIIPFHFIFTVGISWFFELFDHTLTNYKFVGIPTVVEFLCDMSCDIPTVSSIFLLFCQSI